eukprot:UN32703
MKRGIRRLSLERQSRFQLSDAQISKYRTDGHIVFTDFLNADELEEWREVVDDAVSIRGPDWKFPEKGQVDCTNVDFEYYENVFKQRLQLHQSSENLHKLMIKHWGPIIGEIGCILEDINGLQLWHDQCLYKEPYANPTSPHVDVPYWSFDTPNAISFWLALDDANHENGCLYFWPGSHEIVRNQNNPYEEIKIGKNMRDIFDIYPEVRKIEQRSVPMKAGSISFHNGLLVHGAGPNFTNKTRRAMTGALMPLDCVFNGKQNILSNKQMEKLTIGKSVFNNPKENPIFFSRK